MFELKLVLATLITRFDFALTDKDGRVSTFVSSGMNPMPNLDAHALQFPTKDEHKQTWLKYWPRKY
jgi:hypothetical protein